MKEQIILTGRQGTGQGDLMKVCLKAEFADILPLKKKNTQGDPTAFTGSKLKQSLTSFADIISGFF